VNKAGYVTSERWCGDRWIAALAHRRVRLDLAGFGGYLRSEPDWDTRWCRLDAWLCYALGAGRATLTSADHDDQALGAGSALVVPAGTRFRIRSRAGERVAFHRFRFHIREPRVGTERAPLVVATAGSVQPLIEALVAEADCRAVAGHSLRSAGLLMALFVQLRRLRAEAGVERRRLDLHQRERVRAWFDRRIAEDPAADLGPEELAAELGLSADYATRLFRVSFGVPPRTWLLHQRLAAMAMVLAESAAPIVAIARRFGYANPSLFSAQFRRRYGCTPRAYRHRHRA